jgi:NADPH2:quinone reductase
MRALVMTEPSPGPDCTEVRELPDPRPGAGQVSVDVAYAGVNFIDVMARRGDPGYASSWPYVPGLEVAGTIREAGDGVTGLPPGLPVAAFTRGGGGLAEIAVAGADLVAPLPRALTRPGQVTAAAAAVPLMLSTALLLVRDVARFRPGERVLMHSAAGGVGSVVAQVVAALGGGPRIGTVGSPDKVAAARAAGWDVTLVRGESLAEAIRAAADGGVDRGVDGGVDVILDPSGTHLLELDLEVAAPGGRIVLFGNPAGGQPAPLPALGRLIGGNVAIAGFSMSRLAAAAPARVGAALRTGLELVADGKVELAVTELGGLDEVPAVHQLLAEGRGRGKYVAAVAG